MSGFRLLGFQGLGFDPLIVNSESPSSPPKTTNRPLWGSSARRNAGFVVVSKRHPHFPWPCYTSGKVGEAYTAVHMRCGDIGHKGGLSRHYMLYPEWLRNFLPVVTKGITHVILLGNRKEHGGGSGQACNTKFSEILRSPLLSLLLQILTQFFW